MVHTDPSEPPDPVPLHRITADLTATLLWDEAGNRWVFDGPAVFRRSPAYCSDTHVLGGAARCEFIRETLADGAPDLPRRYIADETAKAIGAPYG